MSPTLWTALEFVLLATALAAALLVRPWRMLAAGPAGAGLATPLLATLTVLAWLWAGAASAALPFLLQLSGAPLAVLVLGWPLAVPVLALAGLGTMLTADASWQAALTTTVWCGLLPATLMLLLGHAVRRGLGTHPAVYLIARAYAVPLLALFASIVAAALAGHALAGVDGKIVPLAAFLLAMGEAAWTCAVATLLVACKPQWLATWSDALYLGPRTPAAPRLQP